jgi:hypothetical protein
MIDRITESCLDHRGGKLLDVASRDTRQWEYSQRRINLLFPEFRKYIQVCSILNLDARNITQSQTIEDQASDCITLGKSSSVYFRD